MTIEQLLIPRIKIVAPWPMMYPYFKKGMIFQLESKGTYSMYHAYTKNEPIHLQPADAELYPENLRLLEWWEDRNIEDMPEYVTVIGHGTFKVKTWMIAALVCEFTDSQVARLKMCSPATREDYEAQQK